MSICGNDFIPIIITIVCCGLLFVYCNSRLAELKNAIEKQNRVLTSFISSIQNDIRSGGAGGAMFGGGGGAQKLASDEAMAAVKRFEQDKIVVSDDEDSDDESESDSDSDDGDSDSVSDTESDHGHGHGQEEEKKLNLNMEFNDLKPGEKHNVYTVFNEITTHNVYNNDYVSVEENDLVIDIGFNYGLFSLTSLKYKPSKIIAFESYNLLQKQKETLLDKIKWNLGIDLGNLPFDPILVTCFDGLIEDKHPYNFIAKAVIKDLLDSPDAASRTIPIVQKIVWPLRTALQSKNM